MRKILVVTAMGLVLGCLSHPVLAEQGHEQPDVASQGVFSGALTKIVACLAAAGAVLAGSIGISRIASRAVDSIARQPEAASQMFTAWLFPAAMIETAMLFALVICFLVSLR